MSRRRFSLLRNNGALYLDGVIEPGSIDAATVRRSLREVQDQDAVRLMIDSPGGDCHEGFGIYVALREAGKPVDVDIVGLARSMASVIAMVGRRIRIVATGTITLHEAAISDERALLAAGPRLTASTLRSLSSRCASTDASHLDILARRSGMDRSTLVEWRRTERTLTACEAVQLGFADEIIPIPGAGRGGAEARAAACLLSEHGSTGAALLAVRPHPHNTGATHGS